MYHLSLFDRTKRRRPYTSFFDTLVGSVNNNARDQVRSVCPIHFSLDHSSDKLISFSTRNSILLRVQLSNIFSPKIRSQVWGAAYTRVRPIRGCGLYAGKYGNPLNTDTFLCPESQTLIYRQPCFTDTGSLGGGIFLEFIGIHLSEFTRQRQ